MPFPQGTEYNAVVQHPRIAFSDAHLKECLAETTPLGLPKPYSGGFTTTYHLLNGKLGYSWAVRCFTRDIPDLEARYKALERFFDKHRNESCFVKTWYLQHGIRANGAWHPTIKMQWVEGNSLDAYVRLQLNKPKVIEKLATEFVALIRRLEQIGFAHGDLQHGNILVKDDKLHLIDYDGSYVPEIASLGTNNLGHVNYQHPARSEALFNAQVDRFSAIAIYIGLIAVAAQPSLWRDFDNGENILFRRDDFTEPAKSVLFARLSSLGHMSPIANRFKQVCRFDPQDVPSLDAFLRDDYAAPKMHAANAAPWYGRRAQYPIIDCDQRELLLQHVGKRVEVIGCISGIFENREYQFPYQFLNLGPQDYPNHSVTLVLWTEGLKSFQDANRDPWKLMNQWISATGVASVHKVKGRLVPQIVVDNQAQVQVLADGSNEARARLAAYALDPEVNASASPSISRWERVGEQQYSMDAAAIFNKLYGENGSNAGTTTIGANSTNGSQSQASGEAHWYAPYIIGQTTSKSQTQRRIIGNSAAHASTSHPSSHPSASAIPLTQPSWQVRLISGWQKLKRWLIDFAEFIWQR